MGTLTPNLSVLPESQRLLWPRLDATPRHFVPQVQLVQSSICNPGTRLNSAVL